MIFSLQRPWCAFKTQKICQRKKGRGSVSKALDVCSINNVVSDYACTKVSYRAAMAALRREKRWEAAIKLLDDMRRRRGVEPDEVKLSTMKC